MAAAVDGGRQRSSRDAWLVTGLRVCLLRAGPRERCEHFQDGVKGRLFLRGDLPVSQDTLDDEENVEEGAQKQSGVARQSCKSFVGSNSSLLKRLDAHERVERLLAAGHLKSVVELVDRCPKQWVPEWYLVTWSRMRRSSARPLATAIGNGHFGLAEWCLSSRRMQAWLNTAHTFVWAHGGDSWTTPCCAVLGACVRVGWQWGIGRIWHLVERRLAAVSLQSKENAAHEFRYFRLDAVHAAACAGSLLHMERFAGTELDGFHVPSFVCSTACMKRALASREHAVPLSAIEWLYRHVDMRHRSQAVERVPWLEIVRKNSLPLLEWVEHNHSCYVIENNALPVSMQCPGLSRDVLDWLTHPGRLVDQRSSAARAVRYACKFGNVHALEYLWSDEWLPHWHDHAISDPRKTSGLFKLACKAGSLACVEFLRDKGCTPTRWGKCLPCACASRNLDLQLVQLIMRLMQDDGLDEDDNVRHTDICAAACSAAGHSHLSVFRLFLQARISVNSTEVVKCALHARAWSTAFWLLHHGFDFPEPLTYDLAIRVVQGAHRRLIQLVVTRLAAQENGGAAPLCATHARQMYVQDMGVHAPARLTVKSLVTFATRPAVSVRDGTLVRWLWEHSPCQATIRAAVVESAWHGALAIMEWCFAQVDDNRASAFLLQTLLCASAEQGHLHVVQWLCKRHGLAIAEEQEHPLCKPAQLAAWLGHLRVVEWLCSPQRQLPAAATCCADEILFEACPRSLDVVEFCCEHLGCAVTSRHLAHATQHGTPASLSVGEIERYLVARASLTARVVSAATQWLSS